MLLIKNCVENEQKQNGSRAVLYDFLNGPNQVSFCLFLLFSHGKYSTNIINDKSIDGVLGTRTQGDRMVGADVSTEL